MFKLGYKPGDKLKVEYLGTDEEGRHRVSRKALLPSPEDKVSLETMYTLCVWNFVELFNI